MFDEIFLLVFQWVVACAVQKCRSCVAWLYNFPTFALRFGGRLDGLKGTNNWKRKKFYFFLARRESFSTFAFRFGGRG